MVEGPAHVEKQHAREPGDLWPPVNQTGRSAKAQSQTADANALQESDGGVVPVKQPNKEGQPLAEAVEGRQRPKENDAQSSTSPTQSGEPVS